MMAQSEVGAIKNYLFTVATAEVVSAAVGATITVVGTILAAVVAAAGTISAVAPA